MSQSTHEDQDCMDAAYGYFQDTFSPLYTLLVKTVQDKFDLSDAQAAFTVGRGLVTLGALNVAYSMGVALGQPNNELGSLSLDVLRYTIDQSHKLSLQEESNG